MADNKTPESMFEQTLKSLPLNASPQDLYKLPKVKLVRSFALAMQIAKVSIEKMQALVGECQKFATIIDKQNEVIAKMKDEMLNLETKLASTEVVAAAGGLASSFDPDKRPKRIPAT